MLARHGSGSGLVSPPLEWNIVRIAMKFCTAIDDPQRIKTTDIGYPLTFSLAPSWGLHLNVLTTIGCIATEFGAHNVFLRMNCNDFSDPLTFLLVLPSGQSFNVSNSLVCDQIPSYIPISLDFVCSDANKLN